MKTTEEEMVQIEIPLQPAGKKTIRAVDLFAGAGGTSTGLISAIKRAGYKIDLTAINHDKFAIKTHSSNYPWAKHILTDIEDVDPYSVAPEGHLDILIGSPSCVHFSRARGGKPKDEQNRATPWYMVRWLAALDVSAFLVENVAELLTWGPLDDDKNPITSMKGETFNRWIATIKALGYHIEWKVLNAADYGDFTSRRRLFVMGTKGDAPIKWPEPTHSRDGKDGKKKWKAAKEIIDWSIVGESIFTRKRPLSVNTLMRIEKGLQKFASPDLKPFMVLLEHSKNGSSHIKGMDEPVPTITGARGGAFGLAVPSFILPKEGIYRGNQGQSIDNPLGTIVAGRDYGYVVRTDFILSQASGGAPRSVDDPVPTIPTAGKHSLIHPFLIEYYGASDVSGLDHPIPTVTGKDRFALLKPEILKKPDDGTDETPKLVQPEFIIDGVRYKLDVKYRMLKPHELSAAMGFPESYKFAGTKTQIVKQIGNAVAVNMANALVSSILEVIQ